MKQREIPYIEYGGVHKRLADWAKDLNLNHGSLKRRYYLKVPQETTEQRAQRVLFGKRVPHTASPKHMAKEALIANVSLWADRWLRGESLVNPPFVAELLGAHYFYRSKGKCIKDLTFGLQSQDRIPSLHYLPYLLRMQESFDSPEDKKARLKMVPTPILDLTRWRSFNPAEALLLCAPDPVVLAGGHDLDDPDLWGQTEPLAFEPGALV